MNKKFRFFPKSAYRHCLVRRKGGSVLLERLPEEFQEAFRDENQGVDSSYLRNPGSESASLFIREEARPEIGFTRFASRNAEGREIRLLPACWTLSLEGKEQDAAKRSLRPKPWIRISGWTLDSPRSRPWSHVRDGQAARRFGPYVKIGTGK